MKIFSSFLQLAVQLLDLAALFVENDAASPFQLCGIVIPKLVCKYQNNNSIVEPLSINTMFNPSPPPKQLPNLQYYSQQFR
jgi:hypothetical protein